MSTVYKLKLRKRGKIDRKTTSEIDAPFEVFKGDSYQNSCKAFKDAYAAAHDAAASGKYHRVVLGGTAMVEIYVWE